MHERTLQWALWHCAAYNSRRHVIRTTASTHRSSSEKPLIRDALRRLFETGANFKIVGEASDDGAEAVKLARELRPDILLLDTSMPKYRGPEALRKLCVASRVILLTWRPREKSQIVEWLQLGAPGVLLLYSARQTLLKAIQTVMVGEYWVGRDSVCSAQVKLVDALAERVQSLIGVERKVDVSRRRAKAKRPIGRIQSLLHEEVLKLRELVQQEEGKMKGPIDVQRLLAVQADRSGMKSRTPQT